MIVDNAQAHAFKHLINSVQSGAVPDSLESTRQSLLNKLLKASSEFHARYVDNAEIIKMPSMGMISISHEELPDPVSMFGTDIHVNHIARITIYEALIRKSTGAIEKDIVLAEFIMSESQFGNMMINPRSGEGIPATLLTYSGSPAPEYDVASDPTKTNVSLLMDKVNRTSDQVERFIDEASQLIEKAKIDGRIGSKGIAQINFLLKMVPDYTVSNSAFSVNLVNEAISSRVEEATLNIHLSAVSFSGFYLEKNN